jgi:hypothetical protein
MEHEEDTGSIEEDSVIDIQKERDKNAHNVEELMC